MVKIRQQIAHQEITFSSWLTEKGGFLIFKVKILWWRGIQWHTVLFILNMLKEREDPRLFNSAFMWQFIIRLLFTNLNLGQGDRDLLYSLLVHTYISDFRICFRLMSYTTAEDQQDLYPLWKDSLKNQEVSAILIVITEY